MTSASLGPGNAGDLGPIILKAATGVAGFYGSPFGRSDFLGSMDGNPAFALRVFRFFSADHPQEDVHDAFMALINHERADPAPLDLGPLVFLGQHETSTETTVGASVQVLIAAAVRHEANHVAPASAVVASRASDGSGNLIQGVAASPPSGSTTELPEAVADAAGRSSLVTLLDPAGVQSSEQDARTDLPPPRGSDLLAAFLPVDRVTLEDAADRFVEGLKDLGVELSLGTGPREVIPHSLAWLAAIGSLELGRRWLRRNREKTPGRGDLVVKTMSGAGKTPGWPGSWSARIL
ncbi:MAG TPA: hypothetical protein VGZ22_20585 [Isosphaeraceae bacterium]|nr:hypothetical protein [Isosphaeraceae bacterium]